MRVALRSKKREKVILHKRYIVKHLPKKRTALANGSFILLLTFISLRNYLFSLLCCL